MNKGNKKLKMLTIGSGLIIAIVLLIIFVLFPLYNKITVMKAEIYDKRVQLQINQEQRKNIEQTRKDYNKIKNDIDKISSIFVDSDKTLDLISDFENIASQQSIQQKITINNNDLNQDKIINLTISIDGKFENINKYLNQIENLNTYIIISSLDFSSNENDINLLFNAHAYLL